MKNNKLLKLISLAILSLAVPGIISCSDDGEGSSPEPVAAFNVTVDAATKTATFENTSTDALTYSWSFGDDNTSIEMSPSHTYEADGAYVVTLIATNDVGSDETSSAIEIKIEITIDGDFSDWEEVDALSERSADNDGVVSAVKAVSDLNNIYFYVEGDDALHGFAQLYLNSDGDSLTGFMHYGVHPIAGADLELGGGTEIAELFEFSFDAETNPNRFEWSFETAVADFNSATMYTAIMKTGNAYEFAISRTLLEGAPDYVSFSLGDVDTSDGGWNEHGYLPNEGEEYIELSLF